MALNILKYDVISDVTTGRAEISSGPKSPPPITLADFRELHLNFVGRTSFGALHETMISLSDEQLQHVMDLAAPVPIEQRDAFLRALVGELQLRPDLGSGELHRLCLEVRRRIAPWVTTMAAGVR